MLARELWAIAADVSALDTMAQGISLTSVPDLGIAKRRLASGSQQSIDARGCLDLGKHFRQVWLAAGLDNHSVPLCYLQQLFEDHAFLLGREFHELESPPKHPRFHRSVGTAERHSNFLDPDSRGGRDDHLEVGKVITNFGAL